MTDWVELVKAAGPVLVGLGGLYVAYGSGIRPGREARHHARVEQLYLEMLDALLAERKDVFGTFSKDKRQPGEEVVTGDLFRPLTSRIDLYAGPAVRDAWERSRQPLDELSLRLFVEPGEVDGQTAGNLLYRHEQARDALVRAMQVDLGVPQRRSGWLTGVSPQRSGWLRRRTD